MKIAICIPTYKRPHLLKLLLEDILQQNLLPDYFIIVDGDPKSGDVYEMLQGIQTSIPINYVPSNHGNLSYQRYLGWRAAANLEVDILIYFDDDERLHQTNVLQYLITPFVSPNVVGVGCQIRFGLSTDGSDAGNMRAGIKHQPRLVKILGNSRYTYPGDITPVGHRRKPVDNFEDYINIFWLHGGAMAYRMSAISHQTFSDDLFALDHVRCGLGEDTFLSRRIGYKGKLLYTFRAVVDHPNADTPKSYPFEAYKYAYAATYSRRFQNDYYRVYDPPKLVDRWALVKSYLGNVFLTWTKFMTKPSQLNFSLARGTTLGAIHGLVRPPTAKRLTPNIDWRADAEEALLAVEVI